MLSSVEAPSTRISTGPLTYQWEFDYRGGVFHPDASGVDLVAPLYVYPSEGTFTVALRVQDGDGAVSEIKVATVAVLPVVETDGQ